MLVGGSSQIPGSDPRVALDCYLLLKADPSPKKGLKKAPAVPWSSLSRSSIVGGTLEPGIPWL